MRNWIDHCPNSLYSALIFQSGAAWRQRLLDDIGDQGAVTALIGRRSNAELQTLMTNLGGHCLASLAETFASVDHDLPVVFVVCTIKGWRTPLAGHKDNHAGLMTVEQMRKFQAGKGVPEGADWDPHAGLAVAPTEFDRFLATALQLHYSRLHVRFNPRPRVSGRLTDAIVPPGGPSFNPRPRVSGRPPQQERRRA